MLHMTPIQSIVRSCNIANEDQVRAQQWKAFQHMMSTEVQIMKQRNKR
jgi:hypothetical protein